MYSFGRWFFVELVKVLAKTIFAVQVVLMVFCGLVISAIIVGMIYSPKATSLTLAICAIVSLLAISLCKAAAAGNVYCPSCKSEDHTVASINYKRGAGKHSHITRACNTCGHKW